MDRQGIERRRKTLTAASMILAPALFFASDAVWPVTSTDADDILADATGSTGRVYLGAGLALLAFVAMAGAVLGLAHLLHERRPALALIGGGLGLAGIVGGAAATSAVGLVLSEAPGRDPLIMTNLIDDLMDKATPIFITSLLLSVGLIILAVGLAQARVVAWPAAVGLEVSALVLGVAVPLAWKPVILVAELVLLASLGSIGVQVLGETDEEWEHTPEFHGFGRPVTA